jgi:hypothetical protein
LLIAAVVGFGGTTLGVVGWIRWRRRDVARIIRLGEAEWAALGLIKVGARHLDGGTERPGSQPVGILSVKNGDLAWHPNRAARKRGHRDATWRLSDVYRLHFEKRRLPTALAIREVHLGIKDEVVVVWLYTDAGTLPGWFTATA